MLGDEAPLTIEIDAFDCACTDTILYFADPKTRPRDSIKTIARHVISFIETNRLKYALTISTRAEIVMMYRHQNIGDLIIIPQLKYQKQILTENMLWFV
jgi:hypothetical protein